MKTISYLFILTLCMQSVLAISASVSIPEQYANIEVGERLYFDMDIKFPENKERIDMQFEYQIFDGDGVKIAQVSTVKAIETQISFIDFVNIPEDAKKGLASIHVRIFDYHDQVNEQVESSFVITGSGESSINLYYLIILAVTLFVGILVGVDIMMHRKH